MFAVFGVIHRAVRGPANIRRISREILQDLHADGVMYAEIRSTPREHKEHGMTKKDYVDAVLAGWQEYTSLAARSGLEQAPLARLILSLDRRDAPAEHETTVDLALEYVKQGEERIVGIDLSGDPTKGKWADWEPALLRARQGGLKITLHAGEVGGDARWDQEMQRMLDFKPDRLGHVCFISETNLARLRALQIPVELCLTSNVLSKSVPSYEEHHFRLHYQASTSGCPVTLCTDDSAVFGSPLSREYAIAATTFGLGEDDMWSLAHNGVSAAFLGSEHKRALAARLLACKASLLQESEGRPVADGLDNFVASRTN